MTLPDALQTLLNAVDTYADAMEALGPKGCEAMKDFKRPPQLRKAMRMVEKLHGRIEAARARRAKKPHRPDCLQ